MNELLSNLGLVILVCFTGVGIYVAGKSMFGGNSNEPDRVLDHLPINEKATRDWRDSALKKAAARHGKKFKCAPAKKGFVYDNHRRTEPASRFLQELPDDREKKPRIAIVNAGGSRKTG